jgi:branched-chain amino acid transport system permease protein
VFGVLMVVAFLMRNLVHSSQGRAIISIREDEIAAKTMGIDVAQVRRWPLPLGRSLPAGGRVVCPSVRFPAPSTFNVIKGFDPLIIIVFGGWAVSRHDSGVIRLCRHDRGSARGAAKDMDPSWRLVIYAIMLLAMMLLRQQGLLGRTEWLWLRAPLPPARDIPVPDRSSPDGSSPSARKEGQA